MLRNSAIATVSLISTLKAYDTIKRNNTISSNAESAKLFSLETVNSNYIPPKIIFTTGNSHYAQWCFNKFIKPVMDSAAIDVICVDSVGDLDVFALMNQPPPIKKGWFYNYPIEKAAQVVLPPIVAIGVPAWPELLGLVNQTLGGVSTEDSTIDSKIDPAVTTENKPRSEITTETPGILPKFGFFPCREMTGYKLIPYKIFRWFTQNTVADIYCQKALVIASGLQKEDLKTRILNDQDLKLGSGLDIYGLDNSGEAIKIDERVARRLEVLEF